MEKSEQIWYEVLPEQCPPVDASPCDGVYYRIANGNPAEDSDFYSQRRMQPNKEFVGEGIDECVVRSLSVFSSLESAEKRLKLPKFKSAHIVELTLTGVDGKIKKTFGPYHYSWWRTKCFDIQKSKTIR